MRRSGGIQLIVSVAALSLFSVASYPQAESTDVECHSTSISTWFKTDRAVKQGEVLVFPGLNNKAGVMDPLVQRLLAGGLDVWRGVFEDEIALTGRTRAQIGESWLNSVREAFEQASTEPNTPRYVLGYSLGALALVRWLDQCEDCTVDGMVLIAPAVKLTRGAALLRVMTPFRGLGLSLPSRAPSDLRQSTRVSLRTYSALLASIRAVDRLDSRQSLNSIPTLVFANLRDEVVSEKKLRRWIERNDLGAWRLRYVETRPEIQDSYQHLLVLPEHAGRGPWQRMMEEIEGALEGDARTGTE